MHAVLNQSAVSFFIWQLLGVVGPGHMPFRHRGDMRNPHGRHGIQQPKKFHADGNFQLINHQALLGLFVFACWYGQQLAQPVDKGARCGRPARESVYIQLDSQQFRLRGARLLQRRTQQRLQLF